jgi:hypothetical protein
MRSREGRLWNGASCIRILCFFVLLVPVFVFYIPISPPRVRSSLHCPHPGYHPYTFFSIYFFCWTYPFAITVNPSTVSTDVLITLTPFSNPLINSLLLLFNDHHSWMKLDAFRERPRPLSPSFVFVVKHRDFPEAEN